MRNQFVSKQHMLLSRARVEDSLFGNAGFPNDMIVNPELTFGLNSMGDIFCVKA